MHVSEAALEHVGRFVHATCELEAALSVSFPPGWLPETGLARLCRQIAPHLPTDTSAALLTIARLRNKAVHYAHGHGAVDANSAQYVWTVIQKVRPEWETQELSGESVYFLWSQPKPPAELVAAMTQAHRIVRQPTPNVTTAEHLTSPSRTPARSQEAPHSTPTRVHKQPPHADVASRWIYVGFGVSIPLGVVGYVGWSVHDSRSHGAVQPYFVAMAVISTFVYAVCFVLSWRGEWKNSRIARAHTQDGVAHARRSAQAGAHQNEQRKRQLESARAAMTAWRDVLASQSVDLTTYFDKLGRFTVGMAILETQVKQRLGVRANGLMKAIRPHETAVPPDVFRALHELAVKRNAILHARGYCGDIDTALDRVRSAEVLASSWLKATDHP